MLSAKRLPSTFFLLGRDIRRQKPLDLVIRERKIGCRTENKEKIPPFIRQTSRFHSCIASVWLAKVGGKRPRPTYKTSQTKGLVFAFGYATFLFWLDREFEDNSRTSRRVQLRLSQCQFYRHCAEEEAIWNPTLLEAELENFEAWSQVLEQKLFPTHQSKHLSGKNFGLSCSVCGLDIYCTSQGLQGKEDN